MASNSSAKELHERAELFRRWADETDSPEMREAFLSLAAGIADRLSSSAQSRSGAIHSAARSAPRQGSTLRGRLATVILKIDRWRLKDCNRPRAFIRKGRLDGHEKGSRFEEESQSPV
jgi:hypothetical protein